jgi:hypothetical protein
VSTNYDDSMYEFAQAVIALEPHDLELGGIYASKRGYHNKRNDLPSTDYSVQLGPDKKGPGDKASAVDITSRSAQGGNYTIIKKYSNRLHAAGVAGDPRMAGWREFFGQTDNDGGVEGWDFYKHEESTSADKSHNWHFHMSELREFIESQVNKQAALSVLKGESLQAYKARGGQFVKASTPDSGGSGSHGSTLAVDGQLGPATIKRWQQVMHTPVDGKISNPSDLVKAVQRALNTHGANPKLAVDGRGIEQDGTVTHTIRALQKYFGTPVDGKLDKPSDCIKALQKRLNTNTF